MALEAFTSAAPASARGSGPGFGGAHGRRNGRRLVAAVAEAASPAAAPGSGSGSGRASARRDGRELVAEVAVAGAPAQPLGSARDWRLLSAGAALALAAHVGLQWLTHLPWWQRVRRRFIWWSPDVPQVGPYGAYAGALPLPAGPRKQP